ncbi:hypothetical protein PVAP13_9KG031457 [Panicum virgatum]|uniref:Uncharacterized protein n=1 Tax=Panicum virgatum TaxID=38727 RepID=A0A8T0NHI8_PANVG|nr:hypothetical protein PVAP13_9KG031457 [Panicum virgatum]
MANATYSRTVSHEREGGRWCARRPLEPAGRTCTCCHWSRLWDPPLSRTPLQPAAGWLISLALRFCWPDAAAAGEMQQGGASCSCTDAFAHVGRVFLSSQEPTEVEIFYESGAQSYPANSGDSDIKGFNDP